jgi:hypothetical protein
MHQTGSLDIFLEWLGIMNLLVLMYDEKKKRAGGKAATTTAIKAGYDQSSTIESITKKNLFVVYVLISYQRMILLEEVAHIITLLCQLCILLCVAY